MGYNATVVVEIGRDDDEWVMFAGMPFMSRTEKYSALQDEGTNGHPRNMEEDTKQFLLEHCCDDPVDKGWRTAEQFLEYVSRNVEERDADWHAVAALVRHLHEKKAIDQHQFEVRVVYAFS
jgi:hypothetical protein